jgi:ABC-type glycerol-3-phosphate transport system permease component
MVGLDVMIITGQYIWNDFFWPNLFINSPRRMTAPLALVSVQAQQGGGPIGAVFAGLSILCVPVTYRVHYLSTSPDGGYRLPGNFQVGRGEHSGAG